MRVGWGRPADELPETGRTVLERSPALKRPGGPGEEARFTTTLVPSGGAIVRRRSSGWQAFDWVPAPLRVAAVPEGVEDRTSAVRDSAVGVTRHHPHSADKVNESRALYNLVKTQGRDGAAGIVQGERALARIEHTERGSVKRDSEKPAGEGTES